jgi:aldose 1-epimerase
MNNVRFGLTRVGREARRLTGLLVVSALLAGAAGCSKPEPPQPPPPPPTPQGMEVRATNYGGIITALLVPDSSGKLGDVTLGMSSFDGYLKNSPYFGAIIGRYGNRIGKARFKIDDQTYKLPANDGPNTLHGGVKGFDKVVWQAEPFEKEDSVGVIFTYTSKDGEEGFPGNLQTRVTYPLT